MLVAGQRMGRRDSTSWEWWGGRGVVIDWAWIGWVFDEVDWGIGNCWCNSGTYGFDMGRLKWDMGICGFGLRSGLRRTWTSVCMCLEYDTRAVAKRIQTPLSTLVIALLMVLVVFIPYEIWQYGELLCDTAINFPNVEIIRRDFSVPEGWESHLREKEPSFYFFFFFGRSGIPKATSTHLPPNGQSAKSIFPWR